MPNHVLRQSRATFMFALSPLVLALFSAPSTHAHTVHNDAGVSVTLPPIVVTAANVSGSLLLQTDPKAARQPLPAQDGADFLANILGFSQIRKGAASGDVIFRGMSGSRVGILMDGQEIYGGCPMRMDPPTAYVYPDAFDSVTIIKGPQSVLHGSGQSAATVNFEHRHVRPDAFSVRGVASITAAQAARYDQTTDMTLEDATYYLRWSGVRAQAKDYKDGDGNVVHSQYQRWNHYAAVGWTPDDHTRLELSGNFGNGQAAAADSPMMDGSQYRRQNLGFLMEKQRLTPWLSKVQMRLYRNKVDHVMDNYSLRPTPSGRYMASNPDRLLKGAYLAATFAPTTQPWELTLGADRQTNQHRGRASGMQPSAAAATAAYRNRPRMNNLRFEQTGLFGELRYDLPADAQIVSGLRLDRHQVQDQRLHSPNRGERDKRHLNSGFLRLEKNFSQGYTYVGIGHAQRFPDFWERMKTDEKGVENAVIKVRPEKLTQLDIGGQYTTDDTTLNLSAFYSNIQDYVLLYWPDGGAQANTLNVDARTWGFELETQYRFNAAWQASVGVSYVHGTNRTHHQPLAQQPPLQTQVGVDYTQPNWSVGVLWRAALAQNRYHLHYGGIASKDKGSTPGFGVLALHASVRVTSGFLLSAGVDNLFNKTYAQHLSKVGGGSVGIWPRDRRIHEPGRTMWLKAQLSF